MKTKRFCKSTVSVILALIMLVSMCTVAFVNTSAAETDVAQTGANMTDGMKIYFVPTSAWTGDSAWFAAYFFNGSGTQWVKATDSNSDGTYEVTVSGTWSNVIFTRKNPSNTTLASWDNVWNQTQDLGYDGTNNCFTIKQKEGDNKYSCNVSKIDDGGSSGGDTVGEFPCDFTEGKREVYLVDQAGWGKANCYVWKSTSDNTSYVNWPGESMSDTGETQTINGTAYKIYKYEVPANYSMLIFSNNGSSQTADLNFQQYNYYNNSTKKWTYKEPIADGGGGGDDDPVGDTTTIYIRDNASGNYDDEHPKFFAKGKTDGKVYEMAQTIDTVTGRTLWYAEVASSNTGFDFYRTSYFFSKSNCTSGYWNTWSASSRGTKTLYDIGSGWSSTTINPADGTMNNFWYGLWVDTKGDRNPETAVRAELSGSVFSLYLPSYVDLSDVRLYSSFDSTKISGGSYSTAITLTPDDATPVTLSTGTRYTVTTQMGSTTKNFTMYVYTTSDTASMLLTTEEELYTGKTEALYNSNAWPSGSGIEDETDVVNTYKDAIETKGSIYVYSENGKLVNDASGATKLKKIKGRGNSTFKASMQIYGKYAYNFNLDKKVDLTVLDDGVTNKSTKSKKWCLLANNPDITMLRNTFIYELADRVGIKYGPETRLVDVYDNGKYLGAYIITEKVEYGGSTLMNDMENLDDGNVLANSVFEPGTDPEDEEYLYEFDTDDLDAGTTSTYTVNGKTYNYKYYATYDRPEVTDEETGEVLVEAASNLTFKSPTDYNTKYNFLLEFELYDRYQNEASWFKSPRTGQAVVVKYPEFATNEEMKWIIGEYEKAESAIYDNNGDFDKISAAVDVDSFARMYLIQELALNLDSCATSYYIHNDQATDKLVSSPVWDYDWSMGAYMNTTDSGKKYVYNGSSVSVNSTTLDNPEQMFVKNKALKTDSGDNDKTANYNFQAKLVHNSDVWERCQYYWTNFFVPNLSRFLDNDYTDATSQKDDGVVEGDMLTEWLPRFESSMAMNHARWNTISSNIVDGWGTKNTTNYNPRTFSFGTGTSNAGSNTMSYSNSVYYLNDWLVARWNYMSSSASGKGNLYNEELREVVEAKNASFVGTQDGDKLTITPSVELYYNGERMDQDYPNRITYDVYLNGVIETSSTLDTPVTITLPSGVESEVYIVAYFTLAPNTKATSPVQDFSYGVSDYVVSNVKFTAVQNDGVVTVSPSASVTKDGVEVSLAQKEYTVFVNKVAQVTKTFGEGNANVTIPEGQVSEIFIKVNPVGVSTVSGTSATQTFSYGVEAIMVPVTFNFKASGSTRYQPKIKVNGNDIVSMTKSTSIGTNASGMQEYFWYTATIELEKDVATKVTFTNAYSMNATSTVTASAETAYFFGVDNLNQGSVVVDLTEADEYIRNFKQSASHMVYNDLYDVEVATTSIAGTSYNMGDANVDGVTNISDVSEIQRSIALLSTPSEVGAALSDYNLDSVSSIMDATDIQLRLAQG